MSIWTDIKKIPSSNSNVWKYVFEKEEAVAEAVLYRYPTFAKRTVICCSTQSGCPVGCRFCGAGDYFVKSLSSEEIVSQVRHLLTNNNIDVPNVERLQIMFMSMGEPMLNYKNLEKAIRTLHLLYPRAALLISSVGPKSAYWKELRKLSWDISTVGLQFSVHESSDEKRNALIPFKNKMSLEEIVFEGEKWRDLTGRKPFFNYCAHDGNVSDDDVERLFALFNPNHWECTVSVVCEREEHVAAANEKQRGLAKSFMNKMIAKGYGVRMFDPAGQDDIGGGCGQLWFVQEWMRQNPDKAKPSAGFKLPVVHVPGFINQG